jgi:hypothetical protein
MGTRDEPSFWKDFLIEVRDELQLVKIFNIFRTVFNYLFNIDKITSSITGGTFDNISKPIPYLLWTLAVAIFSASIAHHIEPEGLSVVGKLEEEFLPIAIVSLYVFPNSLALHWIMNPGYRDFPEAVYINCYFLGTLFLWYSAALPFKTTNENDPHFGSAAIAILVWLWIFIRYFQIQMEVYDVGLFKVLFKTIFVVIVGAALFFATISVVILVLKAIGVPI